MQKKISFFFIVALMTSAFWGFTGIGAEEMDKSIQGESYHNEKGLSHFKNGFYNFTPKHQKEKASKEYELAIQEFNKALVINPNYAEAHLNLARVYYVQKKFLKAAEHYKKLTNLDPYDIDGYLYTASAYEKAQKYDEAIAELEIAKEKTTDPQIIEKLDSYIEKIEQRKQ
ncbi:MAG: tetratricopeptide repeat protein [Desulfobacterales bacterium]